MHSNHPSPQSVQAAADAAQAKTDAATYQRALDAPDCTGGIYERTTYGERQCTQGTQVITNEQDCEAAAESCGGTYQTVGSWHEAFKAA